MKPAISIPGIAGSSFVFFWRNLGAILRRIWLVALIACAILYGSITLYLQQLQSFLTAPTDAHASIVLALLGIAILVLIFIYSIALAAVTDLALGCDRPTGLLRIAHRECRLYAALLRFALVMAVLTIPGTVACVELGRFAPDLEFTAEILLMAGLVGLALRIGFLLPAIAVATQQGEVLRRSWALSRGLFWRLFAIAVILVLPGVALELLGEFFGRMTGVFPLIADEDTLQGHILLFRNIVPAFAILLSLSALLILVLQTIASARVYRTLVDEAPPAD